ncbi:MAG: diadenylate cyclase CdaA [Candidatus Omnitrophica bacterium]|nr:diadenylate cyclase CdaA [Candidatus Omnitrophota bacterium]
MTGSVVDFLKMILEILIIWTIVYRVLLFVQGTRVVQVLRGFLVLLALFAVTTFLELSVLNWLLTKVFALSVLGFLIIFQPEIRRVLTQLGQTYFELLAPVPEEGLVNKISQSLLSLAQKRIGALIAFEQGIGLKAFIETGVRLDAAVTTELITTLFSPLGPLHDGGVIIAGGRVVAAGCLFPLSQKENIDRQFGTRHRAALGLSEETDAVVAVVSEETGKISIAYHGELRQDVAGSDFAFALKDVLQQKKPERISWLLRGKKYAHSPRA